MEEYIEAMRLPDAYGGELELVAFQTITERPVCVLVNNHRLGTYPGTIDFSTHNKNTAYLKLSGQHYEPLIMRDDKKNILETSKDSFTPSPTSITNSLYINQEGNPIMGDGEEFKRLDVLSEDGLIDLELNIALKKIKHKRENNDKKEFQVEKSEKRRRVDDPRQLKITSYINKKITSPNKQESTSQKSECASSVSKQHQLQMVSFLTKPSLHLIETAAESKLKANRKIHQNVTHQFPNRRRARITAEENKENECVDCDSEDEGKDTTEALSTNKICDQFFFQKQTHQSQFEQLQRKEISHYTYLINSVLAVSSAVSAMTGMIQTLYSNTYSATIITKAIEKVRHFWNSVLPSEEIKEFKNSGYFFFNTKRNNIALRIEEQGSANSKLNSDEIILDTEELYSEFIVYDFGCRMNATVISEACVERVFSQIGKMISIHQLSISDDTMLGMLSCANEQK
jgi:hypothetical protein